MSEGKKGDFYSIGHLAKMAGLTTRTIRYYEERGLLNAIKRVEGGRRAYTDDDLRRLKFIKRLKLLGLTLAEMEELAEVDSGSSATQVRGASNQLPAYER